MYGVKFSYAKVYSEEEVRVARTRAEFALRGRLQACKFAEAEKRPKHTKGSCKVHEDLPQSKRKKIVTTMKVDEICVSSFIGERHVRAIHQKKGVPMLENKSMVVAPPAPGVGDKVQRVMYTPARFLRRLIKQDECFLYNIGAHYGVSIEVGTPMTKIQIQGPNVNVRACYSYMKVLLVKWHQEDAGKQ